MKYLLRNRARLLAITIGLMLTMTFAQATTYYTWNNGDPASLNSWWTSNNGTGGHPANFTTAGDVFTIQNNNTMTATGPWSIGAGATTSSSLTIQSSCTLAMASYLLTLNSCNVTISSSGTLTGSGGITVSGTLSNNTLSGITTTGAFTISKTAGTASLSGTNTCTSLIINSGATLSLSGGENNSLSTGTGGVQLYTSSTSPGSTITGTGTLTLGGDVAVSNNGLPYGASISCNVALTNNSSRLFTVADDGTTATDLKISGVISTNGALTKQGAGTMELSGLNTYSGTTTVTAGILRATNNTIAANTNGPFGKHASGLNLSGGKIESNVVTFSRPIAVTGTNSGLDAYGSARTISSTITLAIASTFNLNVGGTTAASAEGQDLTLSGVISNSSGTLTLTKIGSSNVILSNASNSYSGLTTISAGTLKLGSAGGATNTPLGTTTTGTSVSSGGTLDLNGFTLGTSEALTLNGTGVSSVGALVNSSASGTGVTYNGVITLGSASSIGTTSATTGNITLGSNGISGSQNLTKVGAGTLHLGTGTCTLSTLTISSGTLTCTAGIMNIAGGFTNSGTFTHNSGTVYFNGGSSQTITGITVFNNLTINNSGGVNTSANITVNGVLGLTSANPSATQGTLDMGANTLIITSPTASVTGLGDVTGIVKRTHTFSPNVPYQFGSQYTTINFLGTTANRPGEISCKVVIGSYLPGKSGSVLRYYSFANTSITGTADEVVLNLSYKDASSTYNELNGNSDETKLALMDRHVTATPFYHEHGKTNNSETNNWVGISGFKIDYVSQSSLDLKQWGFITSTITRKEWNGSINTVWSTKENWSDNLAPVSTDNVLIPDVSTASKHFPVLDQSISINTLELATNAHLYAGTDPTYYNITISGNITAENNIPAWHNNGTFHPGAGTVTFNHIATALPILIDGETSFYNLATLNTNTYLQAGSGTILHIAGNISQGSGTYIDFVANPNTVEYTGSIAIINPTEPSGVNGYRNLTITRTTSEIITLPASTLHIAGDLTNNGSIAHNSGTVVMDGIGAQQTIKGSASTTFYNLTIGDGNINESDNVLVTTAMAVSGTLNVTSYSTLDLGTTALSGSLSTISGTGFMKTQNTTSAPFPASKTWPFDVEFNGASGQTIPATSGFNNFKVNNSSGIALGGGSTINGALNFNSGKITTSTNTLSLGASATVSGAGTGKYVYGTLRRYIPNTSAPSVTYDIGDASNYTPFTILFAGTTSGSSYIDATTTAAQPVSGSNLSQTKYVNRKWTLTNGGVAGFTSFSPTFTFVPSDIQGSANTASLAVAEYSGSTWYPLTSGTRTSTSTQCTGATRFGDFYIGEAASLTFQGGSPYDWATPSNWPFGNVPTATDNVIIPTDKSVVISPATMAACNDLTVSAPGTLTITSDGTNSGGLIVNGTASGNVTYNRYMLGNRWYIVSSPVYISQSIGSWLPGKDIPTANGDAVNFGMTSYVESTNTWGSYYTTDTTALFKIGKGYLLRKRTSGTIAFTGTINASPAQRTIVRTITGWNSVGNPFTCAIGMASSATSPDNFLSQNATQLDPSYIAAYIWDDPTNYKAINNSPFSGKTYGGSLGTDDVSPGQGFLVKSITGGGSLTFNSAMCYYENDQILRSLAVNTWNTLILQAASGGQNRTTSMGFRSDMTTGLDPTYDAGIFKSDPNFELYTRLVDDNGVDFAVQCLPSDDWANLSIPVGIDFPLGGEVVFSLGSIDIPQGYYPLLTDKVLNSSTYLKTTGDKYTVTLPQSTAGAGRFFLTFGDGVITSTEKPVNASISLLKVYPNPATSILNIELEGYSGAVKIQIMNILGIVVREMRQDLADIGRHSFEMSVSSLSKGLYMVNAVYSDGSRKTERVIIGR